jgi:hypothetical protein
MTNQFTCLLVFSLSSFVLFQNTESSLDFLLFSLPWSFNLGIASLIVCSNICWHLAYFHLVCYYSYLILVRVKTKMCNQKVILKINYRMILVNLRRLNEVILLINQFNRGFWRKYSAIMFAFYNGIICALLYETFFVNSDLLTKSMLGYILQLNLCVFSCYILSSILVFLQFKEIAKVIRKNYLCSRENTSVIGKVKVNYVIYSTFIEFL